MSTTDNATNLENLWNRMKARSTWLLFSASSSRVLTFVLAQHDNYKNKF
jgi:hypothetical protein